MRRRPEVVQMARNRPRPENDAEPFRIDFALFQPGVGHRQLRRRDGEPAGPHHRVEALALLLIEIITGVEVQNLAAEADG